MAQVLPPGLLALVVGPAVTLAFGAALCAGECATPSPRRQRPEALPPAARAALGAADTVTGRKQAFAARDADWVLAYDRAAAWLVARQEPNGLWAQAAGKAAAANGAATGALALLALHAGGSTLRSGPHKDAIRRAAAALRDLQRPDGSFAARADDGILFTDALATWALGVTSERAAYVSLRPLVRKAAERVASVRDLDGAFLRGDRPDTVQTVFGTLALLAADAALGVEDEHLQGHAFAVLAAHTGHGGRIGWTGRNAPPPDGLGDHAASPLVETATAFGVYLQLALGRTPDREPDLQRGLELLRYAPPRWDAKAGTVDPLYWLFGAHAAALAGGDVHASWCRELRTQVVAAQRATGDDAGSWPAVGPWADELGEVGTTAAIAVALAAAWR